MVLYVLTNGIVEIMPRYLKIITKEFFFIVHSRCSQHICTSKANSIYTELERMSFHLHLGYKEIIHYFILCSYCISNAPSLTGLILKVHSCPCRKFHFPLGVSVFVLAMNNVQHKPHLSFPLLTLHIIRVHDLNANLLQCIVGFHEHALGFRTCLQNSAVDYLYTEKS